MDYRYCTSFHCYRPLPLLHMSKTLAKIQNTVALVSKRKLRRSLDRKKICKRTHVQFLTLSHAGINEALKHDIKAEKKHLLCGFFLKKINWLKCTSKCSKLLCYGSGLSRSERTRPFGDSRPQTALPRILLSVPSSPFGFSSPIHGG